MTGGVALFLIAIGAILLFGITTSIAGVSVNTIGIILMIVGAIGLLYALLIHGDRDTRRPTSSH